MSLGASPRPEIQRRHSYELDLQAFFEAHPMVWIQPNEGLERAGGRYAWRSRLPKVRKRIAGVIRWNHVNGPGTAYMFTPYAPLGRDASVPAPDAWPAQEAPYSEGWRLTREV